ncbi:MAG: NAD(P)H-hydrate epimerase [Candidatus Omnitrophica bacterium]|nr:NAD(P)H-hydrate epimerase [Candidatus Omnitrophota bacterium]
MNDVLTRPITASQAKKIDLKIRERSGIPVLLLMENAGSGVADEVIKKICPRDRVAVFCGKGNNGADGFVVARHLIARGIKTEVFLAVKKNVIKDEPDLNLKALLSAGCAVKEVDSFNLASIAGNIKGFGLIVDALLGTGLKGEVALNYAALIGVINSSRAFKVSVDIPSGLCADTGRILGACVRQI